MFEIPLPMTISYTKTLSSTPAALSVRTLSNRPVSSSPQWTVFCTALINMTIVKDSVKIPGILDARPDSLEKLLRRKLGEANLNIYNDVLAYLMISNTDVTSLLSGTSMRAIVAYTTDYITKPGLRTHTMMEIVKNVFTRNTEFLQSVTSRTEKA